MPALPTQKVKKRRILRNQIFREGLAGRVAILNFQTTVGRRFERLAARKNLRLPKLVSN
jgi:hypothetical protein